jgi:hypothetical protein
MRVPVRTLKRLTLESNMTFNQFVAHYNANHGRVPHAVMQQIRRDAVAVLKARFAAGRADSALDFSEFVSRIEKAVAGA